MIFDFFSEQFLSNKHYIWQHICNNPSCCVSAMIVLFPCKLHANNIAKVHPSPKHNMRGFNRYLEHGAQFLFLNCDPPPSAKLRQFFRPVYYCSLAETTDLNVSVETFYYSVHSFIEAFNFTTTIQDSDACEEQDCPMWLNWSEWTECSVSCGGGTREIKRKCQNGFVGQDGCIGNQRRFEPCSENACIEWTNWSEWGSCNKECGNGKMARYRAGYLYFRFFFIFNQVRSLKI